MRIVQVTPSFPPSAFGGVSTHVGLISDGLVERGNTVSVVTTNRYDTRQTMPLNGLTKVNGIDVYYGSAHWPGRYFFAPRVLPVLKHWVPRADLVHVHDTRTFLGLAAYLVSRRTTVPYIVTCHGSLSTWVGDTKLKRAHDRLIGIGLLRKASRVIALNRQELTEIVDFGIPEQKITIIPNTFPLGPQLQTGSARPDKPEAAARTILYLGRIHPIKGIDRLLDAFSLLLERHSNCNLMIVGQDYGAQEPLQRKVRVLGLGSKVSFPGPRYGTEKLALLNEADVLVLPSYKETFPFVVLEAFAHRLPVVATNNCGIAAELAANHAALIASSPREFADAIEQCVYDYSAACDLRSGGLRMLTTTYNWEEAMSLLELTYEQVSAEQPIKGTI